MELLDFDAHFNDALTEWMEKNAKRYKRPEDMEDAAPDVYLQWLETPADWLGGKTPGTYFAQVEDAAALVALLTDYVRSETAVPDPLLDRIAEIRDEAPLLTLVRDAAAPCEARMHGVELLRQLDSTAPMVDYIRWQVERNADDDLLDNALESLHCMCPSVRRFPS